MNNYLIIFYNGIRLDWSEDKMERQKLTVKITHDWCTDKNNETRWIMVDKTGKEFEYWTTSARSMVVGWVYEMTAQVFYDAQQDTWFLRNARSIKLIDDQGFALKNNIK